MKSKKIPPRMLWHNENLTEEFTAVKADEIRTYNDYLQLEDRLTERLMADDSLPFVGTLVTNENPESRSVLARSKPPFSTAASKTEQLNLAWPRGVIFLSHLALPFSPVDPLYGQGPPREKDILFLGQMAIQGERDLLRIPYSFLARLRYNPFYDFLETRTLEWFD